MPAKVLIIAPYPKGEAPSQRFRFEHYLQDLTSKGYKISFRPFWSRNAWSRLYKHGSETSKALFLFTGFLKRLLVVFEIPFYQIVFIHREASPLGPPIVEWVAAKLYRKKTIFDFDDAIWLENTSEVNKLVASLKWHGKTRSICRWVHTVSVGNSFLAEFTKIHNSNTEIQPTVVDTSNRHNTIKKHKEKAKPILGWTGTHSTSRYLEMLLPVLQQLQKEVPFKFMVISNQQPEFDIPNMVFEKWSKSGEIFQLSKFDVGVMPLADSEWEKGKCGFKAIQYLSLGIPCVASPVGVNSSVLMHKKNGFLAATDEEWFSYLKKLLLDQQLRSEFGKNGRAHIIANYSVEACKDSFLAMF